MQRFSIWVPLKLCEITSNKHLHSSKRVKGLHEAPQHAHTYILNHIPSLSTAHLYNKNTRTQTRLLLGTRQHMRGALLFPRHNSFFLHNFYFPPPNARPAPIEIPSKINTPLRFRCAKAQPMSVQQCADWLSRDTAKYTQQKMCSVEN